VESSCEFGNEPSGSMKFWELPSGCTTCGLSSGTQLHNSFSYRSCKIRCFGDIYHLNLQGEERLIVPSSQ
jgi:hypothetical protein